MIDFETLSPLAQKAARALFTLGKLSAGNQALVKELVSSGWCQLIDEKIMLTPEAVAILMDRAVASLATQRRH